MSLKLTCFGLVAATCVFAVTTPALAQSTESDAPIETDAESLPSTAPPSRYFSARVALLGAYRRIYDVSTYGAGAEVMLGGEGALHGGYGGLRLIRGETKAGLTVTELDVLGSYELHVSGVRFGIGGGATTLMIHRVTTNGTMDKLGLTLLGRVGYDFGERTGAYVLGQFEYQSLNGWGPTIYVGYRF